MTDPSGLYGEMCEALNTEIAALGCALRIDPKRPGPHDTMLLLDQTGAELGWLPDHVDAASIAAFAVILDRRSARE